MEQTWTDLDPSLTTININYKIDHFIYLPDLHFCDMVEDSLVKILTSEEVYWDMTSHYQNRISWEE